MGVETHNNTTILARPVLEDTPLSTNVDCDHLISIYVSGAPLITCVLLPDLLSYRCRCGG